MIRFSLSFCLALALPLVAHADWRASAKDCGNVIAAQAHCASCAARWPEISAVPPSARARILRAPMPA